VWEAAVCFFLVITNMTIVGPAGFPVGDVGTDVEGVALEELEDTGVV